MTLPTTTIAPVALRPIRPDDKLRLAAGLTCLSEETRYRRFLSAKPRFTDAELRYLTEIDHINHVALVAVLRDDPGTIVAVGRWVRDRDHPDEAEVAIVVADAFQGRGIGTRLGHALADAALYRGVTRFTATILPGNRAAERLLASITAYLDARDVDRIAA